MGLKKKYKKLKKENRHLRDKIKTIKSWTNTTYRKTSVKTQTSIPSSYDEDFVSPTFDDHY